jgi:molybdopterin-guanine dinucleotide biosynthesis protein A
MNFSAVILAGGKSRRMGRDKAWLEIGGQPLLARQIATVRAAGAMEVFISGRANVDYSVFGCQVLQDRFPDAGPLAGIEAALAAATHPLLLVLAVDLPEMPPQFLRWLTAGCAESSGLIPCLNGRIEPLAAVYPRSAHTLAAMQIRNDDKAVRAFAERCEQAGLVRFAAVPSDNARWFANWNSPADLFQPEKMAVSN